MAKFTGIAQPATGEYKDKGSKFLGYAFPVKNTADVENCLEIVKKDHPKARHICYAYRLGAAKNIYKINDAGEPLNSAGMPIFNTIRSADLTNIIIIVVRYFGGTKLGIPGLIHAYKETAENCLENAILAEDFEKEQVTIQTTYEKLSDLQNFLKKRNVTVTAQEFSDICILTCEFAVEDAATIKNELASLQNIVLLK